MNEKKRLILVITIVLMILSIPGMSMAAETENGNEIDLLKYGYVVYDADGRILPQPNADIDTGAVTIPSGGKVTFPKSLAYYEGRSISYYVSVTGGHVDKLRLSVDSPQKYTIGYFTATKGDWYGSITNTTLNLPSGSYKYAVENKSSVSIRIDSLTCLY